MSNSSSRPKRRPSARRARPVRRPDPPADPFEGVVARLGAQGDGVLETDDGPLYAPRTLAGERIRGQRRGDRAIAVEILEPAPERVAAPCPHFIACGGCQLQHLAPAALSAWKRDQVIEALRQRGFPNPPVTALRPIPTASRRRVTLAYRVDGAAPAIGFLGRRSHDFVACETCLVLHPDIAAAWPGLRRMAGALGSIARQGQIHVLASDTGLDLDLRLGGAEPSPMALDDAVAAARALGAARLSVEGETYLEWQAPIITVGTASVTPPPGGFLQPSAAGQAALGTLVREGVEGLGPVADLFAGCGTFTLTLADTHAVQAVEQDAPALAALDRAVRGATALKPVTMARRDLFRDPLSAKELAGFDAIVLDPPRAGAKAQAEALARADVARVVAVSCNPASFSRDVRILVEGGFVLDAVHPVDQFTWSTHIECVGILYRR